MKPEIISSLLRASSSKTVLLLMDGLGGLAREAGGNTELETARTPNMDRLALEGVCGLHEPVGPGITPGSGPSHLAVFGYDPGTYEVGRGVLSALGINFDLQEGDIAARGNFCTVDGNGLITDRRAGRISTEENRSLCELLSTIEVKGARIFIETEKEHRFLFVLRGTGLSGELYDTDPQQTGKPPLEPRARTAAAEPAAQIVSRFLTEASRLLASRKPANMLLLRGFDSRPAWPTFSERFGLKAAAVAAYPMYRGLARLIGMDVLETGSSYREELDTMKRAWDDYDFFYFHIKSTDSAGEDGDFERKVHVIEEVDALIPEILALKPEVLVITGDHSTPSVLKAHSWHPVPVLLWSRFTRSDASQAFGERECMKGSLGQAFPASDLMPIVLAHALRLDKFGA